MPVDDSIAVNFSFEEGVHMFVKPDDINRCSKNGFKVTFQAYDKEHLWRHINTDINITVVCLLSARH